MELHGTRFASRRYKDDPRPDGQQWLRDAGPLAGAALDTQLQLWLARYQFRNVIPNVGVALHRWLSGQWPLRLLQHIPSAREVLRMQVQGERPVTLIMDRERMLRPVLTKANGFAFMVHDLEHAYKFFNEPRLSTMQRNLFAALERACAGDIFAEDLLDAEFTVRFDYLISDMNTHPWHSLQYLRAILVERHLRSAAFGLTPEAQARIAWVVRAVGACAHATGDVEVAFERIGFGLAHDDDARVIERHLEIAEVVSG